MKARKSLLASAVVAALAAAAGLILWGGTAPPASAVVQSTQSSLTAAATGRVDGTPETVDFSGPVTINSKRVPDPDFGNPDVVVLSIDLSGVTGTGRITGQSYGVSTQGIVTRPLIQNDTVVVTFPFSTSDGTAYQTGAANLDLTFNTGLGVLKTAAVSISNP
jgi:hypothetical protein